MGIIENGNNVDTTALVADSATDLESADVSTSQGDSPRLRDLLNSLNRDNNKDAEILDNRRQEAPLEEDNSPGNETPERIDIEVVPAEEKTPGQLLMEELLERINAEKDQQPEPQPSEIEPEPAPQPEPTPRSEIIYQDPQNQEIQLTVEMRDALLDTLKTGQPLNVNRENAPIVAEIVNDGFASLGQRTRFPTSLPEDPSKVEDYLQRLENAIDGVRRHAIGASGGSEINDYAAYKMLTEMYGYTREDLLPLVPQLPLATSPIINGTAIITSNRGMRWHPTLGGYRDHNGVDLGHPLGTDLHSPMDGEVVRVDNRANATGAGRYTVIYHGIIDGNHVMSYSMHHNANFVSRGEFVRAGDHYADVGSTGYSTGPHAHIEFREVPAHNFVGDMTSQAQIRDILDNPQSYGFRIPSTSENLDTDPLAWFDRIGQSYRQR